MMPDSAPSIRFKARLLRPASGGKGITWTFLVLPNIASAKLPTRNHVTVKGTLNGQPFRATLVPDGQRSHWLKVNRKLREAARATAGDIVTLEIAPAVREAESRVPADLRRALAAIPKARAPPPSRQRGRTMNKYAAEFFGTFWLVFGGCGSK